MTKYTYPQIAAAVYQACTTYDQYLPQLSVDVANAWAKAFAYYGLTVDDLLAGVDRVYADQGSGYRPLPADIAKAAREIRRDRGERAPLPEIQAKHPDNEHYPGDAKAAREPADYPKDWDAEQRTAAYWHALNTHATPHTTAGWKAIAKQLAVAKAKRDNA